METRELKSSIKNAASYLAEQGFEVPHTRLLEALSRALGERNWATLRARLEPGSQAESSDDATLPTVPAQPPVIEWQPSQGRMSEAQFLLYGGNRCPFCGSHELNAEGVEADGPDAWDETSCDECGSSWKTAYKVCGYYGQMPGRGVRHMSEQPTAPTPLLAKILTEVDETQALVLVARSEDHSEFLGTVYRASEALAVIAAQLDEPETVTSLEALLQAIAADEEACVDQLANRRIRVQATEASTSASDARRAATAAAARQGLEVLGKHKTPPCPFGIDDVLVLTYLDGASLKYKGLAYHGFAAWDCLAEFIGDVQGLSAEQMAQACYQVSDECVQALQDARVLPLFVCEYASVARAYREVRDELRQRGRQPLDVFREEVVQELVDHVTHMSKKYEWRTSTLENAFEMSSESSDMLGLEATIPELVQAAYRLS